MTSVQPSNFNNVNASNQVQPQKSEPKESSNKSMSTTTKVLIGAGALAAVAIAGIAIKKSLGSKNITKDLHSELKKLIDTGKLEMEQVTNRGKSIQETIKNADIQGLDIKPHNYDISKESPIIAAYRSFGGYKDGLATPEGAIKAVASNVTNSSELNNMSHVISNYNGWMSKSEIVKIGNSGSSIQKGFASFNGQKRAIVNLKLSNGNGDNYSIFLLSPNRQFTPAQHDLLKFTEHPEKFKPEVFNQLTESNGQNILRHGQTWPKEEPLGNAVKYANWDYDLALSVIQSMAK